MAISSCRVFCARPACPETQRTPPASQGSVPLKCCILTISAACIWAAGVACISTLLAVFLGVFKNLGVV